MKLAKADIAGVFYVSSTGRQTPVSSGYRPQHSIHDNYQTSGEHTYLAQQSVNPGESAEVEVRFISPEFYPRCVWEGRSLIVLEGSRIIGTLQISKIYNESLRTSPEQYKPLWVEPDAP